VEEAGGRQLEGCGRHLQFQPAGAGSGQALTE
jgi:hypothetical protein